MRPSSLLLSVTFALAPLGAVFTACNSANTAAKGPDDAGPGSAADSSTADSGEVGTDSSSPAADSSAAGDSGHATDSGGGVDGAGTDSGSPLQADAGEAGPVDSGPVVCTPDGGATIYAKFDFAATSPSLNGGKGQVLTVNVCDSVVWQNDEANAVAHGVQSPPGNGSLFSTGAILGNSGAGNPFAPVQFTTPGTFSYNCIVHGNMMIGQITVK